MRIEKKINKDPSLTQRKALLENIFLFFVAG